MQRSCDECHRVVADGADDEWRCSACRGTFHAPCVRNKRRTKTSWTCSGCSGRLKPERGLLLAETVKKIIEDGDDDDEVDELWDRMQGVPARDDVSSPSETDETTAESVATKTTSPSLLSTGSRGASPFDQSESDDLPMSTDGVCSSCGLTTIPEMHIMKCCACHVSTAHTLCLQSVSKGRWQCPSCFENERDKAPRRVSRQRGGRTDHVIIPLDEPLDDATVVLCDNCSGEFSMAHLDMRVVPSGQWFCVHCDVAHHANAIDSDEMDDNAVKSRPRKVPKPALKSDEIIDLALDDDSDDATKAAKTSRKRKRDASPSIGDGPKKNTGRAAPPNSTSSKSGKRVPRESKSSKPKKSRKGSGSRGSTPRASPHVSEEEPDDEDEKEAADPSLDNVARQPLRIVVPEPLSERMKRIDDAKQLKTLHQYVGRRVLIRHQDDAPWSIGDVKALDLHRLLFRVDLCDATTQWLPLHSLPVAVGTNTNVFLHLEHQWWPAQKMVLNDPAKLLFGAAKEETDALVLLYTSSGDDEARVVWCPLSSLRSFDKWLATDAAGAYTDDGAWQGAVDTARGANDHYAAIVQDARDRLAREIQKHFVGADWVGKRVGITDYETQTTLVGRITRMDKVPGNGDNYWLETDEGASVVVSPPTPATTESVRSTAWTWRCHLSYADLSMQWYLDADAVLQLQSSGYHDSGLDFDAPATNENAPTCATCLFPLQSASVIACSVCAVTTHKACISPPYERFPVLDKDGTELVGDLEIPYVCASCRSCDGCGASDVDVWQLFETKLARLYLCSKCSVEYAAQQYCPVCHKPHGSDGFCADVLQCTSCELWAHSACEPDEDPMYHATPAESEILDFSVGAIDPTDVCPDDIGSDKLKRKWLDDRLARALSFKSNYDPRTMAKYECASCRQLRLYKLLHALRAEDKFGIFSEPVTVEIAPTYFDIIKSPMDLSTMARQLKERVYVHGLGADFRDHFELLCLNAVTFNSKERDYLVWREAWRFYNAGARLLRQLLPSVLLVPNGKYSESIAAAAKRQLPNNSTLVAKDETGAVPTSTGGAGPTLANAMLAKTKTDDGLGTPMDSPLHVPSPSIGSEEEVDVAASGSTPDVGRPDLFKLPTELGIVPKPYSCVASVVATQSLAQAHVLAWRDACAVCCSTGVPEKFVFCIDCGEAYHQFCLHPPLDVSNNPTKQTKLQAFWRCPNCKLCELCGTNKDEAKLLVCDVCERGCHTFCLRPKLRDVPSTGFVCGNCVECETCHEIQDSASWSPSVSCCIGCMDDSTRDSLLGAPRKPRSRGSNDNNTCPGCQKRWSESETLIQCDGCQSWGHPVCDNITEETLASLTDESEYYCPHCRKKQRKHLKAFRQAWGLQLNIALIQEKRQEITLAWESQQSLRQTLRQYDHWRNYAPLYLYILRCGEECLKALSGRRISFLVEPPSTGFSESMIPVALRQAASRYIRFKRYSRGPRAAARRELRKKQQFFTVDGVASTPSAIAHIVSEAVGAASFLACCTWLYGTKRVSLFTAGLLASHDIPAQLSDALVDRSAVSIDAEVTAITNEYARRKQQTAKPQVDAVSSRPDAPVSPSVIEIPDDADTGSDASVEIETKAPVADIAPKPVRVPEMPVDTALAKMTFAPPLRDWGDWSVTLGAFSDPRVCGLCRESGDDPSFAGRLVFADFDQWVHVNCISWSSEVYEDSYGVLKMCQKARFRGRTYRCAVCSLSGATVGCHGLRCQLNYHLHCATPHLTFTTENQAFCADHWRVHVQKTHSKKRKRDDDVAARKKLKTATTSCEAPDGESVPACDVTACLNDLVDHVVATATLETPTPGVEPLRFLMCEQEATSGKSKKLSKTQLAKGVCYRIGALTVHALGAIEVGNNAWHTVSTLYPMGYRSTRIFWSAVTVQTRCLYECEILLSPTKTPLFRITPSDDSANPISGVSPNDAMNQLRSRLLALYETQRVFSVGWNPFLRRTSWFSYGLVGDHFFGLTVPVVGAALEALPMAPTCALYDPVANPHPYVFCHVLPSEATFDEARTDLKRLRSMREHAKQSSGSIRTDGYLGWQQSKAIKPSTKKKSRTVGLSKHADEPIAGSGNNANKPSVDLEQLPIAMQYRELRKRPFDERLEVRKSRIHGYGLFVKEKIAEGKMIVEYQGQAIRQKVADCREKRYEEMGIGSCYMFRLDADTIVDATRTGNLARFINHSCNPKANARIITIDGNEKKIIIFAKQTLHVGDEVTYDYKFPIEDEAIKCDCGAVNCIGRMN